MLAVHAALGIAVLVVCAAAGALALLALRQRRAGSLVSHGLVLAQTALIAQAGLGLLLLSDGRRAPDRLHYAYGALALGVALSPWFYAPDTPGRRLLWFAIATLVAAALGARALMTGL